MNIQTFLKGLLTFLNNTIVPAILALALFIFLWNAFRYFIIGGSEEESQQKAKSLATWSIAAFVIILSIWGIVNVFVSGLGLSKNPITPDYMCNKFFGGCGEYLTTPSSQPNIEEPRQQDFPTQTRDLREYGDRDNASPESTRVPQGSQSDSDRNNPTPNTSGSEIWNTTNFNELTPTQIAQLPDAITEIANDSVEIVSIAESDTGRSRVVVRDTATGVLTTMTGNQTEDSIVVETTVGGRNASYTITQNENGDVLYYFRGDGINLGNAPVVLTREDFHKIFADMTFPPIRIRDEDMIPFENTGTST